MTKNQLENICNDPECNCKNVEPNFRSWYHDETYTPEYVEKAMREALVACKELQVFYEGIDDEKSPLVPDIKESIKRCIEFLETTNFKVKVN
jgi:hypothetical protein